MNFRSLIRTYNRFSLPKKLATGVAAIAGVGTLIGIPILTLNPVRPRTEINEDAYYKTQVKDQSLAGENIPPSQSNTNFDSATPAQIPISSSNSTQVPDSSNSPSVPVNSSSGSNSSRLDTSEPSNIDETSPGSSIGTGSSPNVPQPNSSLGSNSSGLDTSEPSNIDQTSPGSSIGTGSSANPYSKFLSSGYAPPGSLSANRYNASSTISSPGGSTLNTRYSLPIPTSANPYSLQPSAGNVYSDPNSQSGSNTAQNSLPAAGNTPSISSTGATGTLNGANEDSNQPTPTTSTGSSSN